MPRNATEARVSTTHLQGFQKATMVPTYILSILAAERENIFVELLC